MRTVFVCEKVGRGRERERRGLGEREGERKRERERERESKGGERSERALTGTVTIVSAMKRYLSQCKTKLPGKCPPVLMAVTPGKISVFVPAGPSMNLRSAREGDCCCCCCCCWQSHPLSSAAMKTGTSNSDDQEA